MSKWKEPEVIYLQVSDADHETSVTWCSDRIEDSDICYVAAHVADARLEQAEIARDSHLDALCTIAQHALMIPAYRTELGTKRFDADAVEDSVKKAVARIVNAELER